MTGEALDHLPDGCRACLFWELGHARPDPRQRPLGRPARTDGDYVDELAGDPEVQKQAWCAAQALAGTPPGQVVEAEDETAAYVLFAPPGALAPRKPPVPAASDDALLLATIWVNAYYRQQGVGRLLVQAALREAMRLDLAAVEAYGDRRWRERQCVLPATWLLHEGFEVRREHPRYPLLRLDVRRTARWTDTLEHALEEVLGRLPRGAREPVPEAGQRMTRTGPNGRA